jgi:WD40 repeat protein
LLSSGMFLSSPHLSLIFSISIPYFIVCHDSVSSQGRDGRTLCWDVPRKELKGEVGTASGWTFDVQWSPTLPLLASSSSIDGQVPFLVIS